MTIINNIAAAARTDEEINNTLNWCADSEEEGSNYPGMTYEQGVRDTIEWLAGDADTSPSGE